MRYFYYISWFTQLTLGIGLFSVSFLIQYAVLQGFLNAALSSFALAVMVATAKVTAIIWHRYFVNQHKNAYPDSIRWASLIFRTDLFGLSLFCSIIYLSSQLASLNNEMIEAFMQTAQSIFNWQLQYSQLIFVFSMVISLLIELGIVLSFETMTVSLQSLMQKQQAFELDKQLLKEQLRNQKQAEAIKHDADIELIHAGAERAVSKAKIKMAVA